MKSKFGEYYKLSESEIKQHWEKDIFCFDANVLLNLYRYSPSTREAFFNLLEKIKGRIWITYQAAFEYQKNRLVVINAQKEAYNDIRETLIKKKGEIEAKLNSFKKHPYLQTNDLKKQIESAFNSIGRDLDNLEKKHPDYLDEDPVWDKLSILLDGKVGDDFSKDDLEKLYRDGKKRYDEKVPPGYMDFKEKQNEGNRSLYGDVIVWKQVIEKAKTLDNSIIFITDDLKEDWWYKFKGKTISPRPELIKEFQAETNKRINIYQADKFLEMANKNLAQQTTKEVIKEVRDVRLADEYDIEKEIRDLEMLFEDNGDENFKENARRMVANRESSFEKAIRITAEGADK
jgi:Holliday junction resolvase RusA-like endonuclease